MDELDKITLTCRLLTDERFWQLKRENEKLRLKLFWKKYNTEKLKLYMKIFNQSSKGPNCWCLTCRIAGICDDDEVLYDKKNCGFKPIFENLLRKCELTFGVVDDDYSDFREQNVSNHDTHLDLCPKKDWVYCLLGKKLWQAKSIKSTELIKYKKLFKLLNEK